jgi:MFS family permease
MKPSFWFYLSTLVSSVGSFTFNICLVAFMTRAGFDLFHISLILGLQRLIPMIVNGLFGSFTDRVSAKHSVAITEIGAAIASLGIIWAWEKGPSFYYVMLVLILIKTVMVSFQQGSRAIITKLLSDESYGSNAKNAIWFNKATQGGTLFAGLISFPLIIYADFKTAIIFDLSTFLFSGLVILLLPIKNQINTVKDVPSPGIFQKFKDFYKYNQRAAFLDLVLAVSMMGTTSFTARLMGSDEKWMAILIGSYGLSVWISGFLERSQTIQKYFTVFWLGLGCSYVLVGFFSGQEFTTLTFVLMKDTFYWLLLHRISSHIQMNTPKEVMGSVTSARVTQMILILATGELLVGTWSKSFPIQFDGLWRGLFSVAVFVVLLTPAFRSKAREGYASL